jgi:hypothetical protein
MNGVTMNEQDTAAAVSETIEVPTLVRYSILKHIENAKPGFDETRKFARIWDTLIGKWNWKELHSGHDDVGVANRNMLNKLNLSQDIGDWKPVVSKLSEILNGEGSEPMSVAKETAKEIADLVRERLKANGFDGRPAMSALVLFDRLMAIVPEEKKK